MGVLRSLARILSLALADKSRNGSGSSELATTQPADLTLKQQAGDAANRWLARNRSLVLRQTPVWAQGFAALMVGLGTVVVIGSVVFRIDEVVSVQGQLKSIGGTVEVKTPAGGRVAEVLFKDGDLVSKGQLLLRFDTRQAADQKATLTRLIALEEQELTSRLNTLAGQLTMLDGREAVLQKKLDTKITITDELSKLAEQGGYQRLTLLEQMDQLYELRRQLTEVNEQKGQISLEADQMKLESRKSIDQMRNSLRQAELQLQYQTVFAPAAGVVFDPKARAEGVIAPGDRILSIVPQQGLYAEVFVPNKDIGFVKTGQKAKVRVDAFPFSRYGELDGEVSQIAADALPPDDKLGFYRFPVKLRLNRSFLESKETKIPLQAGMAITSNLKLREKRVISLISDLLVDQTDSVRSIRQQ